MSFVELKNISFVYSRTDPPVIKDFSLSIAKGEMVGVVGPSGSGKSTLLRLVAGLETPATGSVVISSRTVVDKQTYVPPEKRGVGMIFQDYALFPHLTVARNVAFGLHRVPANQRRTRLQEMLQLVQLQGYENRYPHELSGGQQQRVALARALAPKPAILLLDEPFSSLDAHLKAKIRSELRDILVKAKMTSLLVTHDHQDVAAICDRQVMMG